MRIFREINEEIYRQRMAGLEPTVLRVSRVTHDELKREFKQLTLGLDAPKGDLDRVAGLAVHVFEDFSIY